MRIAPIPGTGIDATTGKVIAGFAHVEQSLHKIFTTRFGERVMRRWVGSFVPQLLGKPLVPSTILRFWTAIVVAIELFEPRYRVTRIGISGDPEAMRQGRIGFRIEGEYRPRGHLGDFTSAGIRSFEF